MLVLNLPFKALMFLTLMRPSLVLILMLCPYTTLFRSALLQRIFLMSSLMLLLVWLIFFIVLIKLLPILGTVSEKTVKWMWLVVVALGNNGQDGHLPSCMFACLEAWVAFLCSVLITLLTAPLISSTSG